MCLSVLGFLYTVYPLLIIYLIPPPPPTLTQSFSRGFFISIPRIHAYSEVIANVDPWNEENYNKALTKGVAHARGTYLPGENKTVFLFAHSSGSPWQLTHTNTVFLRLGELQKNDSILVDYNGKRFVYKVTEKKEINPSEINHLTQVNNNKLLLQTCTPIGTALKRLLIYADPVI